MDEYVARIKTAVTGNGRRSWMVYEAGLLLFFWWRCFCFVCQLVRRLFTTSSGALQMQLLLAHAALSQFCVHDVRRCTAVIGAKSTSSDAVLPVGCPVETSHLNVLQRPSACLGRQKFGSLTAGLARYIYTGTSHPSP